jgi:hypothetical protein
MNKIIYLLFFLFFFPSCNKEEGDFPVIIQNCTCQIETASDTYHYPVRPGSDEWKALQSSEQMVEVTQVSFSILNSMSTKGLIETCFENPLFLDLYLSNSPQSFYDHYSNTFNVCKVLINKEDAMNKLIERYSLMCVECIDNNYSSFSGKGGNVKYAFDAIELFLAQYDYLEKTSKSNRVKLAEIVMNRYTEKKNKNWPLYNQLMSVWVAGRIMNIDNHAEIRNLIKNRQEISSFINSGSLLFPSDSILTVDEVILIIMDSFKNYLNY